MFHVCGQRPALTMRVLKHFTMMMMTCDVTEHHVPAVTMLEVLRSLAALCRQIEFVAMKYTF